MFFCCVGTMSDLVQHLFPLSRFQGSTCGSKYYSDCLSHAALWPLWSLLSLFSLCCGFSSDSSVCLCMCVLLAEPPLSVGWINEQTEPAALRWQLCSPWLLRVCVLPCELASSELQKSFTFFSPQVQTGISFLRKTGHDVSAVVSCSRV